MALRKLQLYFDTLIHPMTLFYGTQNGPWINNQFVNHTLDLITLLKMLPRDGAPNLTALQNFFLPNRTNLNTADFELRTFGQMRTQFTQSIDNDQFLLSLKRYALLKMIAMLAQEDYAKITRLFIVDSAPAQMSTEEYEESLAVLCRVLKNQLAKINGIHTEVPMHTPTDVYTAMDNLVVTLSQTQRQYAYFDNPPALYSQGTTYSLEARRWLYTWTLVAGAAFGFAVQYAVNNHVTSAFFLTFMTLWSLYKGLNSLNNLYLQHVACEREHQYTATKMRQSLGLPEPEPEPEFIPQPNAVSRMWLKVQNYVRRQDEIRYNPLTADESTTRLLSETHEDDHQGTELETVKP